jgi:FecR protein
MHTRSVTGALAAAAVLALYTTAIAQDSQIGAAKSTRNQVEGIVGGQAKKLSTGGYIFPDETVRTGNDAVADLVFIDNTNLSVGPTSEVKLDKFVYDPAGSNGAVVIQATKGAFRFVTGSQDKRVYQIKTPFGTLGVRGTIVEMVLKPCDPGVPLDQCGVQLKLVEGNATFTMTNGQTVDLSQDNTVVNVNGNSVVSQSSQIGTILNFASIGSTTTTADAGGGGGGGGGAGPTGPLTAFGGSNSNSTSGGNGSNPVSTASSSGLTVGSSLSGSSSSVSPF